MFGEELTTNTNVTQTAADMAKTYTDRISGQVIALANTEQGQQVLDSLGLKTVVTSVNQDMIRNFLAFWGMFSLVRGVKNNLVKVGIVGAGLWLYSQNKEKIATAFNSLTESSTDVEIVS